VIVADPERAPAEDGAHQDGSRLTLRDPVRDEVPARVAVR
jgi:hypothetical protein